MVHRFAARMMTAIVPLTMMACSEHVPDGPGPGDYTPPSIIDAIAQDVNHVVVVFDEEVTRWTADNPEHYDIPGLNDPRLLLGEDSTATASTVLAASLHDDFRVVTLTTMPMLDLPFVIRVKGVADVHGNAILKTAERPFEGTRLRDTTPPTVVYRLPESDAKGISTRTYITVGFSEAVVPDTFIRGLEVNGEGAKVNFIRFEDRLHFTCAVDFLQPETHYTVVLTGVADLVGNKMPDMQWAFDTQASHETKPPSVISSWPASHSVIVDVNTDLSLTFSEPMDPYSVKLRSSAKYGAMQWSYGGRKVRYESNWLPGSQYTIQIWPGGMRDQAGNGNARLFTLTFSTGEALETGSFTGTITGDPGSSRAADPTGGLVFAGATSPNDLYTSVVGIVVAENTYEIKNLANGTYYPFFVMDSDGNGMYQPKYGDALAVYGVPTWFPPAVPQTAQVADTRITGIDMRVYDPTAVYGLLAYDGVLDGRIRVGLFTPDGFDPTTSTPVMAITGGWDGRWDYVFNTLDTGPIPDGSYYVMAFLDVDGNGVLDPASEPIGVYGGATPVALDLSHGQDAPNTNMTLHHPAPGTIAAAIPWPDAPPSVLLQQVTNMLQE